MAASSKCLMSAVSQSQRQKPLFVLRNLRIRSTQTHSSFNSSPIIIRRLSEVDGKTELKHSRINVDVKVDPDVAQQLDSKHVGASGYVNYRNHPGIMRRVRSSSLPTRLVKAIKVLLEKYPVPTLSAKTEKLARYLCQRQPPLTDAELAHKTKEIEEKIFAEEGDKFSHLAGSEREDLLAAHRKKVLSKLRCNVYHWKPMSYDAFTSYIYLLARVASDFAVQLQCFTEISKRDPDFQPTSVFYNGSRVGAGVWASNEIWPGIAEHYCVDDSIHMNTIARLLLQDGNEQSKVTSIGGTHFRTFSPSPKQNKFSMVLCAYNLMEQPTFEDRTQLVQDLWEMTGSYLVLIEVGTGAGFKLVDEAKQLILHISSQVGADDPLHGHVFAPCPHDKLCPKVRVKNQPCLTECSMKGIDFNKKTCPQLPKTNHRYSYVIIKKGPRNSDSAWPRVLQKAKAQKHTHCHLCLPCGDLQHVIISRGKYEKHLYSCARYVDQGDTLPVSLSLESVTQNFDEVDHFPDDDGETPDTESKS